jgi:signal transduction histidine kinase
MRRRLVITYLVMLAAVLLALEIPLGSNVAAGHTDEMVVDRLLDANRIASIAEPALREGRIQGLADELDQYYRIYGIAAAVVNREATLVAVAGRGPAFEEPLVRQRMREALAGARAGGTGTIWPWQDAPLTLAVPVTSGGEVIGAVVTLSPTNRLRSATVSAWTVAGLAGLLALGVFVLVAGWLARWILRPVTELDDTALRLAAGDFDSRVPANVGPKELRHLARSFNAMADHVGGSLVQQRAFVAQASHQLRNPLAALRIRVDNLARYVQQPGHEEHRLLLEETERLALILDGLLTLARAERDQHRWESVDAAVVADERVLAWAPLALEKGVSLTRTGAGAAPVRVVATAVDQSLDALVDNAVKFSGPGASVVVHVCVDEEAVEVHVVDDGPGLSEEDRAQATDRLWRAPAVQNIQGAGLGLAIVVVLAEASGGQLRLAGAVPHGLRATLRLPRGEQAAAITEN